MARPPSVLLLIADDWSPLAGCYGVTDIETPNIDRLAARGTRFKHAYCVTPSCAASRATLLTGHYPQTNGQFGHVHGIHNLHTQESMPSIPKQLGAHGYRTACIGKLHVQPASVYPWDRLVQDHGPDGSRDVRWLADQTGRFIRDCGDQPFYCHVGFTDPHRDFDNDRGYAEVTERIYDPEQLTVPAFLPDNAATRRELAQYYQAISRLDQGIGFCLEELERAGRAADTLVIVMSDHGMPFPGAKASFYEGGHRCPLIIARPGQEPRVNDALVNWCNLAPTIFDWCGVPHPEGLPEGSLLPILDQEHPEGFDEVYASHCFHAITEHWPYRWVRDRRYKYVRILNPETPLPLASDLYDSETWQAAQADPTGAFGVRTRDGLLHHRPEELYDLREDPHETVNLIDRPELAVVAERLRQKVKQFRQRTRDPWIRISVQRGETGWS
ncbi:MAG: sulfatase [Armatimonadetes bacterium]|nr:sulfatase [Armatimonadota bacterium]